ncbi:MAG: hypothetical protein M1337_03635 [Actinobacteria bacterium]|nr:hypothetical protein [Actinomycetota bacterium]
MLTQKNWGSADIGYDESLPKYDYDAAFGLVWQLVRTNVLAKYVKGWTPRWRNEPNWTRVWLDK